MKRVLFILLLALVGCNLTDQNEKVAVSFTGNKFNVESSGLKSFDIGQWEHYHYPDMIIVTLKNKVNGTVFTAQANNGKQFFENGTDVIHVIPGVYDISVIGGGYPDSEETYSASYYFWSIKDTVVTIDLNTDVIQFSLNKSSALVVKDSDKDIQLIAYRNASLYFTGRGNYDFAYTTPGVYSGLYTDSLGNKTSTEWFDIQADNYYYFLAPNLVKSTVTVPEFTKNEIQF